MGGGQDCWIGERAKLNSKYNKDKWGLKANEQNDRSQWMENY